MNQDKLEVVKQEIARVNADILEISELNGQGWANLVQIPKMSMFTLAISCLTTSNLP